MNLTVSQLAERLDGALEGGADASVTAVASLESAGPSDVTFVLDARRAPQLAQSRAAAAIVSRDAPPAKIPLIRVDHVEAALAKVLAMVGEADSL